MLTLEGLVRRRIRVGFFAAMLSIRVGTSHWSRAAQFLGAFVLLSVVSSLFLKGLDVRLGRVVRVPVMPVVVAPIVVGPLIEDKSLAVGPSGHPEYSNWVRFRLVPHVW